MPRETLYGRLKGFRCDLIDLQRFFRDVVETYPPTPWREAGREYEGWAVQSRDGSIGDAIKRETAADLKKAGYVPVWKALRPTVLMQGIVLELLNQWSRLGLVYHRTRFMRMHHMERPMGWHRDAQEETWRLHIPISTTLGSRFEWRFGEDRIRSVHLPADGSAYLVRVDIEHRAVSDTAVGAGRVHLFTSLNHPPDENFYDSREPLTL